VCELQKQHDDFEVIAMWLANTCQLLNNLRQYSGEKVRQVFCIVFFVFMLCNISWTKILQFVCQLVLCGSSDCLSAGRQFKLTFTFVVSSCGFWLECT